MKSFLSEYGTGLVTVIIVTLLIMMASPVSSTIYGATSSLTKSFAGTMSGEDGNGGMIADADNKLNNIVTNIYESDKEYLETLENRQLTYLSNNAGSGVVGTEIRTYANVSSGITQGLRIIARIDNKTINNLAALNSLNGNLKPQSTNDKELGYGIVVNMRRNIVQNGNKDLIKDTSVASVTKYNAETGGGFVVPAVNTYNKTANYTYFTAVVTDMPMRLWGYDVVARPYITYYDADGTLQTKYFDYTSSYADTGVKEPMGMETEGDDAVGYVGYAGSCAKGYSINYLTTLLHLLNNEEAMEYYKNNTRESYDYLVNQYNLYYGISYSENNSNFFSY